MDAKQLAQIQQFQNNEITESVVYHKLTAKYFITRAGDERMKFLLTLKKIFPSLDKNSRNKKGIYTFGRVKLGQQVEE